MREMFLCATLVLVSVLGICVVASAAWMSHSHPLSWTMANRSFALYRHSNLTEEIPDGEVLLFSPDGVIDGGTYSNGSWHAWRNVWIKNTGTKNMTVYAHVSNVPSGFTITVTDGDDSVDLREGFVFLPVGGSSWFSMDLSWVDATPGETYNGAVLVVEQV